VPAPERPFRGGALADRERIARDLHDVVIQRLFATGMELQSTVPHTTRPEIAERINHAVDALDATILDRRVPLTG
jgi:signal transduction histidine kinase